MYDKEHDFISMINACMVIEWWYREVVLVRVMVNVNPIHCWDGLVQKNWEKQKQKKKKNGVEMRKKEK